MALPASVFRRFHGILGAFYSPANNCVEAVAEGRDPEGPQCRRFWKGRADYSQGDPEEEASEEVVPFVFPRHRAVAQIRYRHRELPAPLQLQMLEGVEKRQGPDDEQGDPLGREEDDWCPEDPGREVSELPDQFSPWYRAHRCHPSLDFPGDHGNDYGVHVRSGRPGF